MLRAAQEVQQLCDAQRWQFCFIGGLALQRWGEPRQTVDVDLTLLTGFGDELPFIRTLLRHFVARIENAESFALERRVLLCKTASGVGVDVALGGLPFEQLAVTRSSLFEYLPGVSLRTCTAEDLIVMKAFAGRGQDWVDVERIIVRQTGRLDWQHISEQLQPLVELKEEPEILDRLRHLRSALE